MEVNPVVLIVDDEKHTRDGLRRALEDKYEIYIADSMEAAMNILSAEKVDILITDLRMQEADTGMKLLERAKTLDPAPVCLMMTAYGSVDVAVEAMKRGAYDYLTKPVDLDRLEILIARALKSRNTEQEVVALRKQVNTRFSFDKILGSSPVMKEVFDIAEQVAPTRATVLIEGESGTGKELFAKAIHQLSPRKIRHLWQFIVRHSPHNYSKANSLAMRKVLLPARLKKGLVDLSLPIMGRYSSMKSGI